ncbi:hypothetical protein MSPP1_003546 [Malassezia sp. CBS 17886]|nr:hypothetical protein MSPP1_003546 [Malassezia sp. CBS 17886]
MDIAGDVFSLRSARDSTADASAASAHGAAGAQSVPEAREDTLRGTGVHTGRPPKRQRTSRGREQAAEACAVHVPSDSAPGASGGNAASPDAPSDMHAGHSSVEDSRGRRAACADPAHASPPSQEPGAREAGPHDPEGDAPPQEGVVAARRRLFGKPISSLLAARTTDAPLRASGLRRKTHIPPLHVNRRPPPPPKVCAPAPKKDVVARDGESGDEESAQVSGEAVDYENEGFL